MYVRLCQVVRADSILLIGNMKWLNDCECECMTFFLYVALRILEVSQIFSFCQHFIFFVSCRSSVKNNSIQRITPVIFFNEIASKSKKNIFFCSAFQLKQTIINFRTIYHALIHWFNNKFHFFNVFQKRKKGNLNEREKQRLI